MINKQIEKPLEPPHQETIVGINTILTKHLDSQKINNMPQQTAVDWLVEQLPLIQQEGLRDIIIQAKQMEKEQIINAVNYGNKSEFYDGTEIELAEQYYNETYGK